MRWSWAPTCNQNQPVDYTLCVAFCLTYITTLHPHLLFRYFIPFIHFFFSVSITPPNGNPKLHLPSQGSFSSVAAFPVVFNSKVLVFYFLNDSIAPITQSSAAQGSPSEPWVSLGFFCCCCFVFVASIVRLCTKRNVFPVSCVRRGAASLERFHCVTTAPSLQRPSSPV